MPYHGLFFWEAFNEKHVAIFCFPHGTKFLENPSKKLFYFFIFGKYYNGGILPSIFQHQLLTNLQYQILQDYQQFSTFLLLQLKGFEYFHLLLFFLLFFVDQLLSLFSVNQNRSQYCFAISFVHLCVDINYSFLFIRMFHIVISLFEVGMFKVKLYPKFLARVLSKVAKGKFE